MAGEELTSPAIVLLGLLGVAELVLAVLANVTAAQWAREPGGRPVGRHDAATRRDVTVAARGAVTARGDAERR